MFVLFGIISVFFNLPSFASISWWVKFYFSFLLLFFFCFVWIFLNVPCVTLCRWSAKQTIPLFVLARNQTKGFGPAISTWPEVVRGRQSESETKGLRSWQLAKGRRREESTRDSRETSRHERGSRPVKEDRIKMSRHSSSFVEVSLGSTLVLVCTCTMLHNSPSALVRILFVLFVCSLSSCSLDCIWCSGKEMCVAPIGTTSWSPAAKKWNGSKSWCNVGAEGVTSHVLVFLLVVVVFFICDFSLSSHPGFDFLSVVFKEPPIFSQTNFALAYVKSFN